MQRSPSTKKAGPSTLRRVTKEPALDVKFMEHVDKKLRADSCKPSTLKVPRRPKRLSTDTAVSLRSPTTVGAVNSHIDDFLAEVRTNGFVLPAEQSTIGSTLSRLESMEHVLCPIAETAESYPGGFNPMILTYSLPKVDTSTKPNTAEVSKSVPQRKKESPSSAWKKLGTPAYHFVKEDKFTEK